MKEETRARIRAKQAALKDEPKPPTVVKYRCGHVKPLKQFLTGQDCGSCRNLRAQEKSCKNREKRAQRKVEQSVAGAREDAGRLPHGAHFVLDYDATTHTWSGCLTAEFAQRLNTFTGTGSSVERLMRELGKRCLEWTVSLTKE